MLAEMRKVEASGITDEEEAVLMRMEIRINRIRSELRNISERSVELKSSGKKSREELLLE